MSGIIFRGDQIFFESDPQNSSQQNINSKVDIQRQETKRPKDKTDKQSRHENSQYKSSQKNKFINKIKDIDPDMSLHSLEKNNNASQGFLDKRQRNKHSAKQSRDRKKLYIQIMQQKQKKLEQELANKKKELQQTKSYLQKVINQNQTMSSFTTGRFQMIKKLQTLIQKKEQEGVQQEINMVIDSLRYRIGATGRQRINTINQYFRQIVNLSLPALHRYMMWSAFQGCHMFGKQQKQSQWYQQVKESLNLSEQQQQEIIKNQQKFKDEKGSLETLIQNLRNIKNRIENKSIQLEDMIDDIRDILTPVQCAKFILFIERNKYRKQLNLCDVNEGESIRKKVKKQDSN